MECRVEYDYVAQEDDELNLKKGDTITNVVQKMEGWWEGTLRGKTGMFPDNFVKVIEKSSSSVPTPVMETPDASKTDNGSNSSSSSVSLRSNSIQSARKLKALFSYLPEQEDELRLEVGDEIEFITEVEEGWWRGNLKGRTGIFPSNFVAEAAPPTNGKVDSDVKSNDLNKSSKGVPDVVPAVPTSPPPDDDPEPEPAPELPPKPVREQVRCFFPYKAQNEDELNMNEGDIITIISKNCEDEGWWRGEFKGKTGLFPDNFVRPIPLNDAMNHSSKLSAPTVPTTKMSPQGRNLTGVKPILPGDNETNGVDKSNGSSEIDGIGNSKVSEKQDKEKESVLSKVKMFSKPIGMYPPLKPTTPTSPSTPTGKSPLTFSLSSERENKREPSVTKEDEKTEEMGEFNSIERGEKLNHLTVSRAKAPKRRPPSTSIVTRDDDEDNEIILTNGSTHSAMSDSLDSPPVNHSTPFNSTLNSTGSASLLDASQETNNSNSSTPSNVSASTAPKPKKLLPWMAELKQTQDKKRSTSNTFNASSPSSATSPASLPPVVSTSSLLPNSLSKEKEPVPTPTPVTHAKAPPLPAKPTSLAVATAASVDKPPSLSPSGVSNTVTSGSTGPAPLISNRAFSLNKKPAPVTPILNNHVNSGHDINAGGDTKQFVPYEDYAKLRDRVSVLESELELLRRQVKMLMDRDSNHGHIV